MNFFSALTVLNPQGTVALAERGLMVNAIIFMLIVAVPVYILTFFFAWWYRVGNKKAKYSPDWEHSKIDELIWWAIPFEIILILGALTWSSTHALDPRVPLDDTKPLVVEVVALNWKWLFIYPEQHIATVNLAKIPVGQPVRFEITADAPMNSFWVPQLGGQIYAMTGMVNPLNLVATKTGTYAGVSANYSGTGFAGMKFNIVATSKQDFDAWVAATHSSQRFLDQASYDTLATPDTVSSPVYFGEIDETLFNSVIMKFMDTSTKVHGHTE